MESATPKKFPNDDYIKETCYNASSPVVLKGIIDDWTVMKWNIQQWSDTFGGLKLTFQMGLQETYRKASGEPVWETERTEITSTFKQFVQWNSSVKIKEDSEFNYFKISKHWSYSGYNYMKDLFDHEVLKQFDWGKLGYDGRDGKDSSIWIGGPGSYTPGHYDTYGYNLVAQIYGTKTWILFPPEQTPFLYPQRIPYEESSVYSRLNLFLLHYGMVPKLKKNQSHKICYQSPNDNDEPSNPLNEGCNYFSNLTPYFIRLQPGDVLCVPRHWWHFVYNEEVSISVNTWVPHPKDDETRVEESIIRLIMASLYKQTNAVEHINPNQTEIFTSSLSQNLKILHHCLKKVCQSGDTFKDSAIKCDNFDKHDPKANVKRQKIEQKEQKSIEKVPRYSFSDLMIMLNVSEFKGRETTNSCENETNINETKNELHSSQIINEKDISTPDNYEEVSFNILSKTKSTIFPSFISGTELNNDLASHVEVDRLSSSGNFVDKTSFMVEFDGNSVSTDEKIDDLDRDELNILDMFVNSLTHPTIIKQIATMCINKYKQ